MKYGDVTNNLTKSNDYFNKLLYRYIIIGTDCKFKKKKIMKCYYIIINNEEKNELIEHINVRNILYNFKMNFIYHDI